MKKLILISSLLAAGTLVANATTTIDLLDIDGTNPTVTVAASAGTGTNSKSTGSLPVATSVTAETIKELETTELQWAYVVAASSMDGQVAISDGKIELQCGNVIGVGDSYGNYAGIWFTTDNLLTSLTYTISYQTAWGSASKGEFVFKGSLYGITADKDGTVTGTELLGTDSKTAGNSSDDLTSGSSEDITFTVSSTDEYDYYAVIFQSYKTVAQAGGAGVVISNLKATVIPEPSLFGLFAGTLALGLAGTRRRRRGNAK